MTFLENWKEVLSLERLAKKTGNGLYGMKALALRRVMDYQSQLKMIDECVSETLVVLKRLHDKKQRLRGEMQDYIIE